MKLSNYDDGSLSYRNGFLDPESSKCPNYIEECCRLPDYYEPVTARPGTLPYQCSFNIFLILSML